MEHYILQQYSQASLQQQASTSDHARQGRQKEDTPLLTNLWHLANYDLYDSTWPVVTATPTSSSAAYD